MLASEASRSADYTQKACFFILLAQAIAAAVVGVLLHVDRPLAAYLLRENGPFELIGFAGCIASVPMFLKAAALYRRHDVLRAAWLVLLALGFFFIGMEEISWGQHFLGWSTPVGLANEQGETNLHNMSFIHRFAHPIGLAILSAYFIILPLLCRAFPFLATLVERLSLPVVSLPIVALFTTTFVLIQPLFAASYKLSTGDPINYGEMQEHIYQLCAALFAYECWQAARRMSDRESALKAIRATS